MLSPFAVVPARSTDDEWVVQRVCGKGVAGLLIESVEQAARRLGEDTIYLTTKDSQTLYARYGWQHAGIVQYPDCDLYLMHKALG
ncbi:GNAT family N-acetyltransferase [Salinicola acroporae]|uniref:GNAT family N-acetyltransferase n=1 Tax=Salinicola acroporae TaxID=1541440 RepID=UPI0013A61D80|nr:GNAT family N-acetyltransferase [Salinicola acroporae]